MNIAEPVIIFTAWRADKPTQVNRDSVAYVKSALDARGIAYRSAQGCYKGETEPAIVVYGYNDAERATVQEFARLFEQESLLLVDANRAARLESPDGELIETLGIFRNVPEGAARSCDAWTRIGTEFYTTELMQGCGATGPHGYRCTHHENDEHVARGTEPGSFAEAWPIDNGSKAP